jgi:hypothetical protein
MTSEFLTVLEPDSIGFLNCTVMLRRQQITGYNVSRIRLFFGTGFAALLVATQVVHALCKIKRAQ